MTTIRIPAEPADARIAVIGRVTTFLIAAYPGKPIRVDVEQDKPERSSDQNAALFGLAYKTIRMETGNDVEELHQWACGEYFGWTEYEVMGQRKKRPVRTTTTDEHGKREVMGKLDFADFFSFVQRKAAEFGIFIPDPDPRWKLDA